MVFPLVDPAPAFNFTVTMWDVSKTPGDIGTGTSVASAFLSVATSFVFGGFSEVQGMDTDLEVETYNEGGLNTNTHQFMKRAKHSNLTFKKGVTNSTAIWDWHNQVMANNAIARKSGLIVLYERNGLDLTGRAARAISGDPVSGAGLPLIDRTPVAMWMFHRGLPESIKGPQLNAKSNEIAIETLEIRHEGLQRMSLSMIPGIENLNAALGETIGLGVAGAGAGLSAGASLI